MKKPFLGTSSGYIPTLDGWRALAILLVLIFHSKIYTVGFLTTRPISHFGLFGVYLFFGISGLLICTRLLEEEEITGRLHLRGFYVRRSLRILPAALLYLAVTATLMKLGILPRGWRAVVFSLSFVRNYLGIAPGSYSTAHFWSLSVEEHFYLFLPVFLLLVKKYRVRILFFLGTVSIACNIYDHHLMRTIRKDWSIQDTLGCSLFLLFPAGLAVLLQRKPVRQWFTKFIQPRFILPICFVILAILPAGFPLIAVVPALLISSTLLHPKSAVSAFLELTPVRFIGKISFGLYLWQQVIFNGRFDPSNNPFGPLHSFPWNFLLVGILATSSYYLVEKPCMRLGHRLAKPAIPGRPELNSLQTPDIHSSSRADVNAVNT
jgi:peptidoglycan/LPS O-acetylase OafA/YrhL